MCEEASKQTLIKEFYRTGTAPPPPRFEIPGSAPVYWGFPEEFPADVKAQERHAS